MDVISTNDIVAILRESAQLIAALAALFAALRAGNAANQAKEAALDAGRQASEAAKEQLVFALRDVARMDQAKRLVHDVREQEAAFSAESNTVPRIVGRSGGPRGGVNRE